MAFSITYPRIAQTTTQIQQGGLGFFTVNDTLYTSSNKLSITGRTKLPFSTITVNDTHLSDTVKDDAPIFSGGALLPSYLGACGTIRLSFIASTGANNNAFIASLFIGGSQGDIVTTNRVFTKGINNDNPFSVVFPFFALSTFLANGGEFYITPENTIDVWDMSLFVNYDTYGALL